MIPQAQCYYSSAPLSPFPNHQNIYEFKSFLALGSLKSLHQDTGIHLHDSPARTLICLNLWKIINHIFYSGQIFEGVSFTREQHFHITDQLINGKINDREITQKPSIALDERFILHQSGQDCFLPLLFFKVFYLLFCGFTAVDIDNTAHGIDGPQVHLDDSTVSLSFTQHILISKSFNQVLSNGKGLSYNKATLLQIGHILKIPFFCRLFPEFVHIGEFIEFILILDRQVFAEEPRDLGLTTNGIVTNDQVIIALTERTLAT